MIDRANIQPLIGAGAAGYALGIIMGVVLTFVFMVEAAPGIWCK